MYGMSELEEKISNSRPLDVHKASWWKTTKDSRVMVVANLKYSWTPDGKELKTKVELLEVGRIEPIEVALEVFRQEVLSGRLRLVVATMPLPPLKFVEV